jgi:hypothetical protein
MTNRNLEIWYYILKEYFELAGQVMTASNSQLIQHRQNHLPPIPLLWRGIHPEGD